MFYEEKRRFYENYLAYVKNTLIEAGHDKGRQHPFRSRYKHTRRVLKWAERLCEERTDVDKEILYPAVIFHDIGYASDVIENHQDASAQLFCEFAKVNGISQTHMEKVASCIRIHSDKYRLKEPSKLTIEQILLMEADLLDEEGALAICWDGLACGYEGKYTYEESLQRTAKEAEGKLIHNPMVTKKGKMLWERKQLLVKQYINELTNDLAEWHE